MKIVHGAVVVSLVAGCASGGAAPPSGPGSAQGAHVGHGHGHGPGHGHGHHGQGMQHRFDGAEGWAKVFDAEDRDAWQKPDEVLSAMGLDKGGKGTELVADVGAGTGYFSVKIAKRVPSGKVFAVDVEGDMVRYLKERATREGLTNLVAVQSTADDPKIPEPVDVVLVVDTLHHIG
ncbi:MAG: methyltransferase domain-containing protein, partial [Myxococcales bacterium]|nr:methyltransferase domain-containing protein [Myxococcales bacterium]